MDHVAPEFVPSSAQRHRRAHFNADLSVDIHCHCLHGFDDGPATLAESVALCRALVADGITDAVATPHQLGRYDLANDGERVRAAVESLAKSLAAEGVPLRVHPGADVRIDERIPSLLEDRRVLSVGDGGRYLLLELPHQSFIDPRRLIADLSKRGVGVIMTHPERHEFLRSHVDKVLPWLAGGAVLQVTSGSLCGEFGAAAEQAAWDWFDAGAVDVVASDAHDCARRPPRMSQAIERISRRYGEDTARRTCLENPRRILAGEPVARAALYPGMPGSA